MRIDLALWLVAAAAVLAGGALHLLTGRAQSAAQVNREGARAPSAALTALSLAATVAGLAWQGLRTGAWPGDTVAEALLILAAGALVLALWLRPGADRLAYSLGLIAIAAVILAGAAAAWTTPLAPFVAQAGTWLFGLRATLVGMGLGAWLFVFPGSLVEVWRAAREGNTAPATGAAGPSTALGDAALRAAYPLLTLALLAGGVWDLAAYAVPWRGAPAELWLAIAWLMGALYLRLPAGETVAGPDVRQTQRWPLIFPAAAGLAAALLAAALTTSLFA